MRIVRFTLHRSVAFYSLDSSCRQCLGIASGWLINNDVRLLKPKAMQSHQSENTAELDSGIVPVKRLCSKYLEVLGLDSTKDARNNVSAHRPVSAVNRPRDDGIVPKKSFREKTM